MLILMFWLVAWRAVAMGVLGSNWGGVAAESCATVASPLEAILEASRPYTEVDPALGVFGSPVNLFLLVAVGMVVALNGLAIARVRTWNPSREAQTFRREDETWHRASIYSTEQEAARTSSANAGGACEKTGTGTSRWDEARSSTDRTAEPVPIFSQAGTEAPMAGIPAQAPFPAPATLPRAAGNPTHTREVWDNPIIWREIMTWAYGRKILIIRLVYLVLFALAAAGLVLLVAGGQPITRAAGATAIAPFSS